MSSCFLFQNFLDRNTIKDLTLMLMYLTSWEESLVPGILNELTDEGLVNAEGEAKAFKLLKAYGIEIDTSE